MAQIFRPGANAIVLAIVLALAVVPVAVLAAGAAYEWTTHVTDVGIIRDQPVPFSHKHHAAELGIDCRYCHTSVDRTAYAGMPPTETCMSCHSQIWTNAALLAPIRESLATNTSIRWQRVNRVPAYVYFDHSIHVAKGVGCSTCHGNVLDMALMVKQEPMTMDWCLDCHRDPARHLRPHEAVFDMTWQPPSNQAEVGRQLAIAAHVRESHLTDCSVCHR